MREDPEKTQKAALEFLRAWLDQQRREEVDGPAQLNLIFNGRPVLSLGFTFKNGYIVGPVDNLN